MHLTTEATKGVSTTVYLMVYIMHVFSCNSEIDGINASFLGSLPARTIYIIL